MMGGMDDDLTLYHPRDLLVVRWCYLLVDGTVGD
jgi:hypothetical protein